MVPIFLYKLTVLSSAWSIIEHYSIFLDRTWLFCKFVQQLVVFYCSHYYQYISSFNIYFFKLVWLWTQHFLCILLYARIRPWNEPALSNEGKGYCSMKQRESLLGFGFTTYRLRVRRATHFATPPRFDLVLLWGGYPSGLFMNIVNSWHIYRSLF